MLVVTSDTGSVTDSGSPNTSHCGAGLMLQGLQRSGINCLVVADISRPGPAEALPSKADSNSSGV